VGVGCVWVCGGGGAGLLFVAVFQPLQTVMVPIMAAIFLGDQVKNFGLEHFKLDC